MANGVFERLATIDNPYIKKFVKEQADNFKYMSNNPIII